MYPAYRHMDCRRPSGGYMPGFLAHPRADSSKRPEAFEPWQSSPNNYGFPVNGYGYCGYGGYPVNYGSYLHYPYPAPSQFFCCGQQPPYAGPFCAPYCPTPPYHQMELSSNGCRKYCSPNSDVRHCCECPNHVHSQKSPEIVKSCDKRGQIDSRDPLQLKDNRYPIVWIPSEYMKNTDDVERPDEMVSRNPEVLPRNRRQDGWFPLDMKDLVSLFGSPVKMSQSHQDGDKQGEPHIPSVWMPSPKILSYKGTDEESNDDSVHPVHKIFQPEQLEVGKSPGVKEDSNRSQGGYGGEHKHPVMEVKLCGNNDNFEDVVECKRVDSSARAKEDVKTKINGASATNESSSVPKTVKLSPVCLRVDPLPKRRNSSSRSLSPSGSKRKTQVTSQDTDSPTAVTCVKMKDDKGSPGLVNSTNKEGKAGKNTENDVGGLLVPGCGSSVRQDSNIPISSESGDLKDRGDLKNEPTEVMEELTDMVTLVKGGQKAEVKKLSNEEAAKLIQSVYRGYKARKWEPLKKLKKIYGVREQLADIRNKVHALESSTERHTDEKQRAAIGETIMSLLLKLDSIQGLHPSFRDVRKSLAKELVAVQEKLDAFETKQQEETKSASGNYRSTIAFAEGESVDKSGEHLDEGENNIKDDGCGATTSSSVITEGLPAEAVELSAGHDSELKTCIQSLFPGLDEEREDNSRAVLTNVGLERSESYGADCDPEGDGVTTVTGEAKQDSTDDGVLNGLTPEAMRAEVDVLSEELLCDEWKSNWDTDCQNEPVEVREEEKCAVSFEEKPKWENEGLEDQAAAVSFEEKPKWEKEGLEDQAAEQRGKINDVAEAMAGDDDELGEHSGAVAEKRPPHGLVVATESEELATQNEPWSMDNVAQDGAAGWSGEMNVVAGEGISRAEMNDVAGEGIEMNVVAGEGISRAGKPPLCNDQSSQSATDGEIEQQVMSEKSEQKDMDDDHMMRVKLNSCRGAGVANERQIEDDVVTQAVNEKLEDEANEMSKREDGGLTKLVAEEKEKTGVVEKNVGMKELMEKLVEAGQAQMDVISELTRRMNDLEKKLSNKLTDNVRSRRRYRGATRRSSRTKDATLAG